MSYREEDESLRRRVETLEAELAAAKETIAQLTGKGAPRELRSAGDSWLLGAPTRVLFERELDERPSDESYAAIAALLRARISAQGQAAQVGGTLTFRHGTTELTIAPTDDGRARLWLRTSYMHLVSLSLMGAVAAMFLVMPVVASLFGPGPLLYAIPLSGILTFFLLRSLIARSIRNARSQLAGVFDAVAVLAQQRPTRRARVANETTNELTTDEEIEEAVIGNPTAGTRL